MIYCCYNQTIEKIDSGYRLPPPPGCPRAMYRMMIKCWYECSYILTAALAIQLYVSDVLLLPFSGILIQNQDHSLDRSQSYCLAVVNIC